MIGPRKKPAENETQARLDKERGRMLHDHLQARGITNEDVLRAMAAVPREMFVPPALKDEAYADKALPIGLSQTISQPYIVGLMTQELALGKNARVLEIGTGSGYQTAILAEIAAKVYTVERIPKLSRRAAETLAALGYKNVSFRIADGSKGWAENAPYDAIIVTAAAPHIPAPLPEQLAPGGRLVIPVGEKFDQRLVKITRRQTGGLSTEYLAPVAFVPLVGEFGFMPDGLEKYLGEE